MDTRLLVSIVDNTYESVDLFDEIPITLTIQQSDLTNLTARRTPYSKTIQVPDTSNNALVFEHYYEVNGLDFNPLNKLPCVVQYRGTDIFTGVLRLNAVIEKKGMRYYEIFILGEVADFTAQFKDLELQDLDYTDLNHNLQYSAITQSWENVNDGMSGLFNGQILYPLINYGLDYQGTGTGATPTFTYTFDETRSFDQSGFSVPPSIFKPSIQIKSVLDRIFARTNYNIVSDFLDSDYFKSIYMDTFQNGKLGIISGTDIQNQNIFRVYTNNQNQQSPIFQQTSSSLTFALNFRGEFPDGYDPLNNFALGTTTQIAVPNEGFFQVPYAGDYFFNFRCNYSNPNAALGTSIFRIAAVAQSTNNVNSVGSTFFLTPQLVCAGDGSELPLDLYFSGSLLTGQFIRLYVLLDGGSNFGTQVKLSGFNNFGVTTAFPMWDLYTSPIIPSDLVDMKVGVPNIRCIDFFRSLITMFNLVVQQDESSKVVRIEPYNWYYDDVDRPRKDWTNILDLDNEKKIEPLSFDLSKELTWTYQETGFENLPYEFSTRFDYVFGRKRYTTGNDIFTDEQVYEVPFGSCPTSGVTNAPNFIIPQYFYLNNGQQAPYATKPHLFFWVGNRYSYKDIFKSVQGPWYLTSGATPVEQTTYPCVSHLSTLESQISEVISDLNFESTFDFFANDTNLIQQFTPFTLYNTFWATYVDNLYSYESRRLTGYFYFRPIDVYETSLKDKIWIKDAAYTIEKLTDANLVNKVLTQISLIKETYPYYKIEPPAPIYILSPNEPYPSPEPFYNTVCFVSTDKDLVCAGTTPTLTVVYTFGSGTIGNLDKVYIDTGTSFQLLPQGTYVRQQSEPTTFVVVNNLGQVLQTTC